MAMRNYWIDRHHSALPLSLTYHLGAWTLIPADLCVHDPQVRLWNRYSRPCGRRLRGWREGVYTRCASEVLNQERGSKCHVQHRDRRIRDIVASQMNGLNGLQVQLCSILECTHALFQPQIAGGIVDRIQVLYRMAAMRANRHENSWTV